MSTVATTERLRLRHVEPGDATSFLELSRDPEVLRYTGTESMASIEEARTLVDELIARYDRHGFGRWAVESRDTGELLGWSGLRAIEGEGVDLGFWFLRRHWGRGYATESARAAIGLAFGTFDLPWLLGRAVTDNVASCRALARLGFEPWRRTSGWGYDEIQYSVLRRPDAPVADIDRDILARVGTLSARALQPADQLDFFMLEANPAVLRYADGDSLDYEGAGHAIEGLGPAALDRAAPLRVLAVSDSTRPFLGTVALVPERDTVEIGFRLLETAQGRGLGRELLCLNLELAHEQYPDRDVTARVDLRNEPCLRTLAAADAPRLPDADAHAHYRWPARRR